jgi:hypothetical protein
VVNRRARSRAKIAARRSAAAATAAKRPLTSRRVLAL